MEFKHYGVRLPTSHYELAKDDAQKLRWSLNLWIQQAVHEKLEREGHKPPEFFNPTNRIE